MARYLLDTNHLSAALKDGSPLDERLITGRMQGLRFVTCVPVLCELAAGIGQTTRRDENWRALRTALRQIKVWPLDLRVAQQYGGVYAELRAKGRALSQVDMMLAALARSASLTILTADKDFDALPDIKAENWLVG